MKFSPLYSNNCWVIKILECVTSFRRAKPFIYESKPLRNTNVIDMTIPVVTNSCKDQLKYRNICIQLKDEVNGVTVPVTS